MQTKTLTVAEIAEIVDGRIEGDESFLISGIAPLDKAQTHELTFLSNPKFQNQLNTTQSGCVLLSNSFESSISNTKIYCKNPYLGFALVSQHLSSNPLPADAVSKSAIVHPSSEIADSVCLGDGVSIGKNCRIERNVTIGANATIGDNCVIGEGTLIYANVSVYHGVAIGKQCIFQSGAVIGSDGFGYANDSGKWIRIAQTGGVRIGDFVDIGANSTVDRGALENTVIGDGVKIDNLCHVAHNVEIGENTAMAAHSGIAGSTVIGKSCTFSGRSSIIGHLNIADGTHLTAGTMVNKSNSKSAVFSSGTGAQENKAWRKNVARFKQLDDMAKKIRMLEQQLKDLTRG